jgi:hypothetical protein
MKIPTLALLLALSFNVHAAGGHNHGVGKLDVSVDGEQLTLELELPLDSAVGFERAPKNDKERAALADAERLLKDAATLFAPTPAAACAIATVTVGMPHTGKASEGDGHADIDARYVFRCATPALLKSVETSLFKHFKRLYRIEARRAMPAGQGAARLSAKQAVIAW